MQNRIGISTACFYPCAVEQSLCEIASLGFKTAEIFFNSLCEYEREYCNIFKEILDKNGIKLISAHAFCIILEPYLFNEYERRRADSVKMMRGFLSAAQFLGAEYYTFHGNFTRATTDGFDYREYAARLDYLSDVAADYGIVLAWENVSWCQSCDPQFIKRTLEYSKSENLAFTFDFKQAFRAGRQPEDYLSVMGDRVVNIHINDVDKDGNCCLSGEGILDYGKYFSFVKNYNGAYIIEVYNDNFTDKLQLVRSRDFLEKII